MAFVRSLQEAIKNMSKIQVIGLVLLIFGIMIAFGVENEHADFLGSLLMGGGVGVLVAGISKKSKSTSD